MSVAREETRTLLALAGPIVLTNLGMQLMMAVDTAMVGRLGSTELAAAGLAGVWISGTQLFFMGLVLGIDPLVTQAHGAGDGAGAGRALQRGLVLSLVTGVLLGLSWLLTEPALVLFGQKPEVARRAGVYAMVQVPTAPFFLGFVALRQYLQGRGILAPALWVMTIGNLFNLGANELLIHGALGIPGLGLVGAGIATALTRVFMLGALAFLVLRRQLHSGAWTAWSDDALNLRELLHVVRIGIPISIQMSLEVFAFGAATLLAGWLGEVPVSAHLVVLSMSSLSYMIPLGFSMAATTRIGNLIGAGDARRAQVTSRIAFRLGAGVMAAFGLVFLIFRRQLPDLYTDEAGVISMAAGILPIAAAFQIFDGTQVVGGGILRGMGDTRPAAWFNFIGYWILALPFAYWLAFPMGLGLRGLWWGLALALLLVAVAMVLWVRARGPGHLLSAPGPAR